MQHSSEESQLPAPALRRSVRRQGDRNPAASFERLQQNGRRFFERSRVRRLSGVHRGHHLQLGQQHRSAGDEPSDRRLQGNEQELHQQKSSEEQPRVVGVGGHLVGGEEAESSEKTARPST